MGLIGLTHADPVDDEERPLKPPPPRNDWRRIAKIAAAVLVPVSLAYGLHVSSEPEGLDAAELRASGVGATDVKATMARSMGAEARMPARSFAAGSFGHSNAVRVRVVLPNELIALPITFADVTAGMQSQWIAFDGKPNEPVVPWRGDGAVRTPSRPGAFWLVLSRGAAADTVADMALFVEVPMPNKMATGINGYHMGRWPKAADNIVPRGFIEVTQRTADFPLTPHLKMSDFVVHDAQDGFPKYLHVREKLLDKLELTIAEIAQMRGRTVSALTLNVASGFRSPAHNGGLSGSAQDSRHMYGDAADIAIDVNNDGVLNEIDARLLAAAAESVERKYPDLVGGIGLYITPDGGGWPYIHIDTRGTRARWRGGVKKGVVDSLPPDATFDSVPASSAASAPAPAPATPAAPAAVKVAPAVPAPARADSVKPATPEPRPTASGAMVKVVSPVMAGAVGAPLMAAPSSPAPAPAAKPSAAAPRRSVARATRPPTARPRAPVREDSRVVAVTGSSAEPQVVAIAGPRSRPSRKAKAPAVAARRPAARRSTPAKAAPRTKGGSASRGQVRSSAAARNGSRRRAAPQVADDPFASAARRFRATRP